MTDLATAADSLHKVAARLSGIEPLLRVLTDTGSSMAWVDLGCSLESIGGLAERLTGELGAIATALEKLEKA